MQNLTSLCGYRSSSRVQAPPINLKERIAALQNRNVSPGQRPTTSPISGTSPTPGSASGGLRAKIAKFEQQGGVPVPRGSFGLGAPPVAENGQSRRKGELYGNRIPGPLRGGGVTISRSGSPLPSEPASPTGRRSSWSGLDSDVDFASPTSSARSPLSSPSQSPPQSPTRIPDSQVILQAPAPRHTAFATALDIARRTANASDVFGRYDARETSLSPPPSSPLPVPMMLPEDHEEQNYDAPPAIVISCEESAPSFSAEMTSGRDETQLVEADSESMETSLSMVPPTPQEENDTSSSLSPSIPVEEAHPEIVDPIPSFSPPPSPHEQPSSPLDNHFPPNPVEVNIEIDTINSPNTKDENPPDLPDVYTLDESDGDGEPETLSAPEIVEPVTESPILLPEADPQDVVPSPLDKDDLALEDYLDDREDVAAEQVDPVEEHPDEEEDHDVGAENVDLALEEYLDEEGLDVAAENVHLALEEYLDEGHDVAAENGDPALEEYLDEEGHDVAPENVDLALEEPPDEEDRDVAAENHNLALEEYLDEEEGYDGAAENVDLALEEHPDEEDLDVAAENHDLALEEYMDEDYDGAAENADLALEEHPDDEGDYDGASENVDLVLEEHPDEEEEDYDAAAEDALEEHPDHEEDLDGAAKNVFVTTGALGQMLQSPIATLAYEDPEAPPPPVLESTPLATPSPSPTQHSFMSTQSYMSSRPLSMIETSPSRVTFAQRVQPVTTRGVPMFIPAVQQETLSPYPQSPEETEFGTVSLHKQSHSYSHPHTYVSHYAEPDLNAAASSSQPFSFSAVVHGKITEIPASSSKSSLRKLPATPQLARVRRSMRAEPPPSPGYGELAVLLEEAAMLEKRLLEGDIPSDARTRASEQQQMAGSREERMKALPPEPQLRREVAEGHLKPKFSFRNSLARSKSGRPRDLNNLNVQAPGSSQREQLRARSAFASIRQPPIQPMPSHKEPSPKKGDHAVGGPQTTPPKPPLPRYISGLRRLASASRSSSSPGAYPRLSVSTSSELSSDDSALVVTPPDHSLNFATAGQLVTATRSTSEFGSESGTMWPSVSPKRIGGSLSRATSYAEKIWHRRRTKSGVSTLSAMDIAGMWFSLV